VPNIKAAVKWTRQSEKRTKRNLDVKTRLKTIYKKAAKGGEEPPARAAAGQFDKAASKGIIHRNKAARKKSRLAKAVQAAAAAPTAKPAKSARSSKSSKASTAKKTAARKTAAKKAPAK